MGFSTEAWVVWFQMSGIYGSLASGRFLPVASLVEMTSNPIRGYELGWQIVATPDRQLCHHHNGSVRGFMANVWRYPFADGCLMVFCNSDVYTPMNQIMADCEQLLFGKTLNVGLPKPLEPKLLAQLEGKFVDNKKRSLVVVSDGKFAQAMIVWDAIRKTPGFLTHDKAGTLQFLFKNEPGLPVTLKRDDGGSVAGLPMLKMEFECAE